MSLEDAFKGELGKEVSRLRKENEEVHAAVIRKQKELLKIRGSLITEVCPHCDCENTIEWNVVEKGYQAYCPNCGKPMMLCSQCTLETDNCSWDKSTGLCHRVIEGYWKNLEDVLVTEDDEGRMLLEKEYRLMYGNEEVITFPAGTEREEIWHWFDEHHPKGVAYLLYGEEQNDED